MAINFVLAFTAPGEYTLHCFDPPPSPPPPPPPPPPPLTDTGSSDADDSVHVLRRAISRVSTQDSPLPSFSAGDLGDLCRQTSKDNRSLLVELVEMRRKKTVQKKLFLAIYMYSSGRLPVKSYKE